VEDSVESLRSGGDLGVLGTGVTPGRSGEAENLGQNHGLVDVSEKTLGSLDTCHHRGSGQILTTAIPFKSFLYRKLLSNYSYCQFTLLMFWVVKFYPPHPRVTFKIKKEYSFMIY